MLNSNLKEICMYFQEERIGRLLSDVKNEIYGEKVKIGEWRVKKCAYRSYELLDEDASEWDHMDGQSHFSGADQHYWVRFSIRIPDHFEGRPVVFHPFGLMDTYMEQDNQAVSFINGEIQQGLDGNHRELLLTSHAQAGQELKVDLFLYTGLGHSELVLNPYIAILHEDVQRLYYNLLVPLDLAKLLETEDKRRIDTLRILNETVNLLDLRKPSSQEFYDSVAKADEFLNREFYFGICSGSDISEVCVGHTHIDVAWLWTLAQTREKAVRSFSTVVKLMEQYPDYIFMSSQPQLYEFVKEDQPELYKKIQKLVKEGRWEAEGAMWVEADCNLISGESIVRQILFGTRFFKKEFQVDNKILWLPDVFGYSAALPQILKKSGIDYFMTTKISWNEFNRMPYDTFMWEGMDGTKVLTYFITTQDYDKKIRETGTTYIGDTNPSKVMGCWQRYQQKEINNEVLNCFGFGDGGGGPTSEMIERSQRLAKGVPGIPKVRMGNSREFFRDLEKRVGGNPRLPQWVGELYLEFHRGTYTSMARNKRYNRKAEYLYQTAELFSVIDWKFGKADGYPQQKLFENWKVILTNQFHDVIPGSSIKAVYDQSQEQYKAVFSAGNSMLGDALHNIVKNMELDQESIVVFNQLGFERDDLVNFTLPAEWKWARIYDGEEELPVQRVSDGELLFFARKVPSKGYKSFRIVRAEKELPAENPFIIGKNHFENPFYSIDIDDNGNLQSIFDKRANREVLKKGCVGNVLQAFEDKPFKFDAWNIDIYYQEKMWEINDVQEIRIEECGPLRAGLHIRRRFLDSTIDQIIYLYRSIPRIDFDTRIDWKEKQILLKAAFPVDVHTDKARYDIQFGNVERPTHWNTSWDTAKFEVCGHKWADLSEGNYGVSLMNDCKYGYDIKDSTMRLTLLKSAIFPNEDADREMHRFTYSLYPHEGNWDAAQVTDVSFNLNCRMHAQLAKANHGVLPPAFSLVRSDCKNVVIDTVKKAEDSDDVILRLYENENKRTDAHITFGKPVKFIYECDLMENEIRQIEVTDNVLCAQFKPYEICTYKIGF